MWRSVAIVPVLLIPSVIVPAAGLLERARVEADARPPVELSIRHPARYQRIAPDSNFIFGSVGTGAALLEIDGRRVAVESNGAFLAWLPVPEAARGDTAVYRILAWNGPDSIRRAFPILRPRSAPPAGARSPWMDALPLTRPVERWYRPGEAFRLVVTGEEGATVHLEVGDLQFPLVDLGEERGTLRRYGARLDLGRIHRGGCRAGACRTGRSWTDGAQAPALEIALDTVQVTLVARKGDGETRTAFRLPLGEMPDPPPVVRLREAHDPVNGSSGVVVGRPTPFGPYRWRFPEGTTAAVGGFLGSRVALDLGSGLVAWVNAEDVTVAQDGAYLESARAFDGRISPGNGAVDFRIGLTRAVPIEVLETGSHSIRLTLHDTFGEINRIAHGVETGVRSVQWAQGPGPRVHVDLEFEWPIWGYRAVFETGKARDYEGPRAEPAGETGTVLRLSIRRPPDIDGDAPLRGRRIAIDPGHPGAGSYGPTGYYEGDANLAIARRLAAMLRDAGASPVMIREGRAALGLYDRTRLARAAGAEIFVSIHNNALPEGIRPLERAGTGTYYYHAHSAQLANAVQEGMVARMGLPDLGVLWGDLAVVREPWMPAVLAEGAFMMIPSHEAALRTPEFQDRYARGVFEGLEAFLRAIAAQEP